MAKLRKALPTFALYGDRVVDMGYVEDGKQRFHLACCRVTDNAEDGFVVEYRTVYTVSRHYKAARIVRDVKVKTEILAKLPPEVDEG